MSKEHLLIQGINRLKWIIAVALVSALAVAAFLITSNKASSNTPRFVTFHKESTRSHLLIIEIPREVKKPMKTRFFEYRWDFFPEIELNNGTYLPAKIVKDGDWTVMYKANGNHLMFLHLPSDLMLDKARLHVIERNSLNLGFGRFKRRISFRTLNMRTDWIDLSRPD